MKRQPLFGMIAFALLGMTSTAWATINLNSSKSNMYRVIYDTSVVSPAQASALLLGLDKLGPANEATLKKWLPANFRMNGIQSDAIRKIIILPINDARKSISVIILSNPADEPQALAVSDEGKGGTKKPTKIEPPKLRGKPTKEQ